MRLEFTEAAVLDLRSIRSWTLDNWGPEQEQVYLSGLWARFEIVLGDPERWKRREDLFPGCQIAPHGKHLILFRVAEGRLQVVRILHGAMDLPQHIPEELE